MVAKVMGDENEITIELDGVTYSGDLHQMSDEEFGPETWQIDGDLFEVESITSLDALEELAREFLERRAIEFSTMTVESDSFDE